ncbi:ATP-binding protein [Micromonospora sp. CA-249363]|uniref:ATP-binding protein n=1 Tax=Micromonospora sp. CA-249363 TaxID=3239963 RepID=UPI003D93BF42
MSQVGERQPSDDELAEELRLVRQAGLVNLRGMELTGLRHCAARCGFGEDTRSSAPVVALLTAVLAEIEEGRLGTAARYTFGLIPGTRDWPGQDRRRRAAEAYGVTVDRFRKSHEHMIVNHVTELILDRVNQADVGPAAVRSTPMQNQPRMPHPPAILGLPPEIAHLEGRSGELADIVAALSVVLADNVPVVCALHGMAGIGKTALAVRAARIVADRYNDGCMFLDLHGFTPGTNPLDVGEVLDRLLRRLGVPGDQIPHSTDDRVALYRDQMAARRLLLILDNARDAAQVRPLIPANARCAMLVTSRHRLVALDEARLVRLDVLGQVDARRLFRSVIGQRAPGTDEAVNRIADACGGLPLALRILAARWRADDTFTPDELAARLSAWPAGVDEFDDGERSIAAALAMSHEALTDDDRSLFTVLGVDPQAEIDVYAVAAMVGRSLAETRATLDRLTTRHLLSRVGRGKYRMHDLVVAYCQRSAAREITAPQRGVLVRRLLDYHLASADSADRTITPHRHREPLKLAHPPAELPDFSAYESALAWLSEMESRLVRLCTVSFAAGHDATCWQLAYTLRGYFFITKRWAPWESTHRTALDAARRSGNVRAAAMIVNNLGLAELEQGNVEAATRHYEEALTLFRTVGDEHGVHTALANRAWLSFYEGDYAEFLSASLTALAFYRAVGADRNAAITERGIALAQVRLGESVEAIAHLIAARATFARLGLRLDEVMTLNCLGEAFQAAGRLAEARDALLQAVDRATPAGTEYERGQAHQRLGNITALTGDVRGARGHWSTALEIFEALDAPQAAQLRDRLADA